MLNVYISGNEKTTSVYIPMMRPPAPGSQYGARRPENAVTKYTPPLLGTDDARVLTSAAVVTRAIESRSHLMALPATAIEPSRAYTGLPF